MPTCFVIQPFSSKFDKRYNEDYKPALEEAGLEPYRVDQDPSTEKLMDSIEKEICKATICLADITTDNPNVWYELGYAFAVGRSVIMVCSNERNGEYPFDRGATSTSSARHSHRTKRHRFRCSPLRYPRAVNTWFRYPASNRHRVRVGIAERLRQAPQRNLETSEGTRQEDC